MWPAVILLVLILIAGGIAGGLLESLVPTPIGKLVLSAVVQVGVIWCAAPYIVALYRYVAAEEVTKSPESLRGSQASRMFFAWGSVEAFVAVFPLLVLLLVGDRGDPVYAGGGLPPLNLVGSIVVLVASLATMILLIRGATLLPTAALAPAAVSLRQAFAETRGHFWYIFGATMLPILPAMLASFLLVIVTVSTFGQQASRWLVLPINIATIAVFALLGIAISARIYQRFARSAAP